MKNFVWVFCILTLVFTSCRPDTYQAVPDSVGGLGILRIDTGNSLKGTFSFDSLSRMDSFGPIFGCMSEFDSPIKGFSRMILFTYRGIQLESATKTLFLDLKGVVSFVSPDSLTLDVRSTLGRAVVRFDQNQSPSLQSFDFSKRESFPNNNDCYTHQDIDRGIFGSRPNSPLYIECPEPDGRIMYGWYHETLKKPKCRL